MRSVTDLTSPAADVAPMDLWHGVTQNGRCWGPFGRRLAAALECRMPDLPGHGRHPMVVSDFDDAVDELLGSEPRMVLGYSMGGRLALHAAVHRPDRVATLVVIGAHPGIEDDDERADRRQQDEDRAAELRRVGLSAFLDDWLRQPLFADLDDDQAGVRDRLRNHTDAVADAFSRLGTGRQIPLWHRLAEIDVPTLVLAGEQDDRYAEIGRRTADAIGANARFDTVPDAGHAAHLARPEATADLVTTWLGRQLPSAAG